MLYPLVKALHLVAMVAWFAGLFYLPRILIYTVEARDQPEAERDALTRQLTIMGRRLWRGITWPAMVATLGFGTWLAVLYNGWREPWLHVKLTLVACLVGYHFTCGALRKRVAAGGGWTSHQLRLWNEVATVLLVGIVLVAAMKNLALSRTFIGALVGLICALTAAVYVYRRVRGRVTPPSPQ